MPLDIQTDMESVFGNQRREEGREMDLRGKLDMIHPIVWTIETTSL